MSKRIVAINETGKRIGEDHQNAKLTNREVDLIREMHEQDGLGYRRLAAKFEISPSQVRHIVKGVWRVQTPAGFKTVYEYETVADYEQV